MALMAMAGESARLTGPAGLPLLSLLLAHCLSTLHALSRPPASSGLRRLSRHQAPTRPHLCLPLCMSLQGRALSGSSTNRLKAGGTENLTHPELHREKNGLRFPRNGPLPFRLGLIVNQPLLLKPNAAGMGMNMTLFVPAPNRRRGRSPGQPQRAAGTGKSEPTY